MVKLYDTAIKAIQTGDLQAWQEAQRLQLIGEWREGKLDRRTDRRVAIKTRARADVDFPFRLIIISFSQSPMPIGSSLKQASEAQSTH